jgi:hypothetical protein
MTMSVVRAKNAVVVIGADLEALHTIIQHASASIRSVRQGRVGPDYEAVLDAAAQLCDVIERELAE